MPNIPKDLFESIQCFFRYRVQKETKKTEKQNLNLGEGGGNNDPNTNIGNSDNDDGDNKEGYRRGDGYKIAVKVVVVVGRYKI